MLRVKNILPLLAIFLTWVLAATILPVTQDEAYYFAWASRLDFGYFDHPPLVALYSIFSQLSDNILVQRLGGLFLAFATGYILFNIAKQFYGSTSFFAEAKLSVFICFTTLAGLALGFLVTPDSGLMFFWALALHEAHQALTKSPKRWVTCGLAVGLGLQSKYTMMIIGPILLMGLIFDNRKQLRSPWPYLGGLIALGIFSPNLYWNHNHNWLTFKFQLRHGLNIEQHQLIDQQFPTSSHIEPLNVPADLYAKMSSFIEKQELQNQSQSQQVGLSAPEISKKNPLKRMIEFLGSQLSLIGLHLLAFLVVAYEGFRRKKSPANMTSFNRSKKTPTLLVSAFYFPLFVFTFISFFSKVEANWAAMIFIAGAAIAPQYIPKNRHKLFYFCGGLHILIVLALMVHARAPFLPILPHKDRFLKETSGYKELTKFVSEKAISVYAESYQIKAMLNYYQPKLPVMQWAGLTRQSDFTRFDKFNGKTPFLLIVHNKLPPEISDHSVEMIEQVRVCADLKVEILQMNEKAAIESSCLEVIQIWYVITYKPR
ncbi:MAG: glycosyltransferase family 39 protein [Oligoflexales bacterium]|nr:glycosyltransferase family 39 protein [Oligoflexales bacterium]